MDDVWKKAALTRGPFRRDSMGKVRKNSDFNFYGKTRAFPQQIRFSTILRFRIEEPFPYYENISKSCVFTRILKFQIEGRGRSAIRRPLKHRPWDFCRSRLAFLRTDSWGKVILKPSRLPFESSSVGLFHSTSRDA